MDAHQTYWGDHLALYKNINHYVVYLKVICYVSVIPPKKSPL